MIIIKYTFILSGFVLLFIVGFIVGKKQGVTNYKQRLKNADVSNQVDSLKLWDKFQKILKNDFKRI